MRPPPPPPLPPAHCRPPTFFHGNKVSPDAAGVWERTNNAKQADMKEPRSANCIVYWRGLQKHTFLAIGYIGDFLPGGLTVDALLCSIPTSRRRSLLRSLQLTPKKVQEKKKGRGRLPMRKVKKICSTFLSSLLLPPPEQ